VDARRSHVCQHAVGDVGVIPFLLGQCCDHAGACADVISVVAVVAAVDRCRCRCRYDYSGYGCSDAREPSEKSTYADVLAVYRYAVEVRHIDPMNIVAYGRSMGASVYLSS
jgi:hypothetical protein